MSLSDTVVPERYVEADYLQFSRPIQIHFLMRLLGILFWPLVLPAGLISRLSDYFFHTFSEFFAIVPFLLGVAMRYEFYKFTLTRCGRNVLFGFGTVFFYRDIQIGSNVHIGMYNTFHHCNLGSNVLIADGCRFLSGKHYHLFERNDIPMTLQGGKYRRIQIHDDCWIGTNAVVMDDIGEGSVIGAGAVVTSAIAPYSIAVGNPAKVIKKRK